MCCSGHLISLIAYVFWLVSFFFFNDTATTEIYTLSLHDALPIYPAPDGKPRYVLDISPVDNTVTVGPAAALDVTALTDRKSTRLNSSHSQISYAVFCLKKKKQ